MDRWEGEPFDDNDRFMLRAMDVTSATAYFGEKGHLFRFQSGHPSERSD